MFSLIGNVEYISFTLDDGLEPYSIRYTREWANNQWGKDVRDFAKSEEEFSKLIDAAYGIGKMKINCKKGLGKFLDFKLFVCRIKPHLALDLLFHYLEQFILNSALCFFNLYISAIFYENEFLDTVKFLMFIVF